MQLLQSPTFLHFVHALLHSLWQAPLLALLLIGFLRFIPADRANLRYLLSLSFLLLTLFTTCITWSLFNHPFTARL
jgi:hypothetical protein